MSWKFFIFSLLTLQKLSPGSMVLLVPTNSSDFFRYSGTSSRWPAEESGKHLKGESQEIFRALDV
jgi:hypothetical protein